MLPSMWILTYLIYSSCVHPTIQETRKPLNLIGLMPMGGTIWPGGAACLPPIMMAINDVNARPGLLDGYELKYILEDTYCHAGFATDNMYKLLYNPPTKIMVIGPGCSVAAEATAQVSYLWNLTQISWGSASPVLSDRVRYPRFFRLMTPDSVYNLARLALMRYFGWKKVSTIHQALDYFSAVTDGFVSKVKGTDIKILTAEILGLDPISGLENLKRHDSRIIFAAAYPDQARVILCSAYKTGLYGPKIVWIFPGWLHDYWWRDYNELVDCSIEQMDKVAEGNLFTGVFYQNPVEEKGIANMTASEFNAAFQALPNYSPDHSKYEFVAPNCYDIIWTSALALQCTQDFLRATGHPKQTLDQFEYSDGDIGNVMLDCMLNMSFVGVGGNVGFGTTGDPMKVLKISQIQNGEKVTVGRYDTLTDELEWINGGIVWRGSSIPRDSTYVVYQQKFIPVSLYATMSALSGTGIIIAIAILIFNITFRENRIVKLSSPNINNSLLLGCILTYSTVIMQTYVPEYEQLMCKLRTFTFTIGFSLAFGSLFSKTWRVYRIFANKKLAKLTIKDSQLFLCVGTLLGVLIAVLCLWELIDPQVITEKGLDSEVFTTAEDVEYHPFIRVCVSKYSVYFSWTIYVINGLLLTFGAFLVFETRKVKIPALNDSHQIGLCLYNIIILSALGLTLSLLLGEQASLIYGILSGFVILGTSTTMAIVFLPKMFAIRNGGDQVHPGASSVIGTVPSTSYFRSQFSASNKPSTSHDVIKSVTKSTSMTKPSLARSS